MTRRNIAFVALVTAICAVGTGNAATIAQAPKISMDRARAIALKAAPGKIMSAEFEKEGGGWRYSFDIQQRGHVQEIGVDGKTGKIVESKSEGKIDRD